MKKVLFFVMIVVFALLLSSCAARKMAKCSHNFEVTKIEPTCTEEGKLTRRCSLCGYTIEETLDKAPHKPERDERGNAIVYGGKKPTCTEWGYDTYHCSVCGEEYIKTIQYTGHSFKDHFCTKCGQADKPLFFTELKATPMSASGYMKFSAKLNNYSGKKVSFVEVTLELYDKNGKIVDTDWTYAVGSEGLKDKSSAYFELIYSGLSSSEYSKWVMSIKSYN